MWLSSVRKDRLRARERRCQARVKRALRAGERPSQTRVKRASGHESDLAKRRWAALPRSPSHAWGRCLGAQATLGGAALEPKQRLGALPRRPSNPCQRCLGRLPTLAQRIEKRPRDTLPAPRTRGDEPCLALATHARLPGLPPTSPLKPCLAPKIIRELTLRNAWLVLRGTKLAGNAGVRRS